MKKMIHKRFTGVLAALLLLASLLIPYRSVLGAPTGSARFSGSDVTLNIGDTYTIGWAINASENVLLEATFAVSSGLTVTGPITCAQGINGGTSTNKVLDYSGSFASFSGNITVHADHAGQFTVQMTEVTMISANDSSSATISSPAFTVYVRTKEQTDASIAEQERIRREQEAEASRQQSEAQSRAESISASASEEERRRKESEDAAYREWVSRSAEEAAEAARRASISQSEADIAASISASESEVEASISASESEREASISASESEVERTRPTEIKTLGFVRYTYGKDADEDGEGDEVFYFVTEGSDLPWPEGAKPISMRLNDVNVLALRMDGMASNTYLVYGMRKENDVPSWEFWHRSTGQFFRYDYLNSDTHFVEPSTEAPTAETDPVKEPSTTKKAETQAPGKTEPPVGPTLPIDPSGGRISARDMIFLVIAGAIGGAAITALIFVLVLKGKKRGSTEGAEETVSSEAPVPEAPVNSAPEETKEKTGDTDAVDLD